MSESRSFCAIASLHASKDLEQGAHPCECIHCQRECDCGQEAKTAWFTFGQAHRHNINGTIFDKDTVVEITAVDPRQVMFDTFKNKWSMHYDEPPDMQHFHKGIIKLPA